MSGVTPGEVADRQIWASLDSNTAYKAVTILLLTIVFYKVVTGSRRSHTLPPWAVLETGLVVAVITKSATARRIYTAISRYGGPLLGTTSIHQVLVGLQGTDRFLSQPSTTLSADSFQHTVMTRIGGLTNTPEMKNKLQRTWRQLLEPIERLFLNDTLAAGAIERARVVQKATWFVSFADDASGMKRWEAAANVRVITPESAETAGVVEADFLKLTRDFGACIAIPLLYGKDFLDRYPQLLDDLWRFDNDLFLLLLIGVPPWAPFRTVRKGIESRSRLLRELGGLYRRIHQHSHGLPVDFDADLSDISAAAMERSEIYNRTGWTFQEQGEGEFAILWGQNANTQPMIFWFLTYVYSTPGLLNDLREEIAPHTKLSRMKPPQIVSLDNAALCRDCPLLKSCIFETYRMANEATSIRHVERPVTVNDGQHQYLLQPGTFVTVPLSLEQRDPSVYADPDKFVPTRFLESDPQTGKPVARYGRLRPWGVGVASCKGRVFAEKEIVAVGSAIIALWDISPVGGTWKLPGMIPGTGVKKPTQDIRVSIRRRVVSL